MTDKYVNSNDNLSSFICVIVDSIVDRKITQYVTWNDASITLETSTSSGSNMD